VAQEEVRFDLGIRMRIAVTVLNIFSSLVSLAVVWFGFRFAYFGLLGLDHGDYSAIILGVVLIAAFLIIPAICVTTSTKLARRGRSPSIFVSLIPLLLIVVAMLAGIWLSHRREVPLAAAFSDPGIVQKIIGVAPPPWRIARVDHDQLPRGQHWDDDYSKHWHGGEELTLTGPTKVMVEDPPKEIEAVESLELWILPATYPDGSLAFDLFGEQMATEIFRDDRVSIYALTSRYDGKNTLDNDVSDVYSEKSILGPPTKGLPISWKSYEADIAGALRH
jgi:predicted outer membrane lipoprotein